MNIVLSKEDIKSLFKFNSDCIVVPKWGSDCVTFNKDGDRYYIVVWEEYDPCTTMLTIDEFVHLIRTKNILLGYEDYKFLFESA